MPCRKYIDKSKEGEKALKLLNAASQGDIETIKTLTASGADINAKDQ